MARRLHEGLAMKRIVGILAMTAFFTGCGVGVDDPEGTAAAMGAGFALEGQVVHVGGEPVQANTGSSSPQFNVFGAGATSFGGGTVSSPQDPIPAFDPRMNQVTGTPSRSGPLPR
jgi:hypothetical protein